MPSGDDERVGWDAGGPGSGGPAAGADPAASTAPSLIRDTVGANALSEIASDFLDLLATAATVYERNGDCAFAAFASGWCRLLDRASREACGAVDDRQALASGRWLCRESCWRDASRRVIRTGEPADVPCRGGIRFHAVPIRAGGEIVGSIGFGYGDPPRDPATLSAIGAAYGVGVEELARKAAEYEPRSPETVALARKRLASAARLIGAIVERGRAEEALRRLSRADEEALRVARMGHWELDVATDMFTFNDQCYALHGVTAREAGGYRMAAERFVREFIHPDDVPAIRDMYRRGRRTADPHFELQAESRIRRADGEIRWMTVWFRAVKDGDGRTVALHGVIQDITDRKRAEEERRGLEERILDVQKLESLGLLAGGIAHDFNNLLMAILGNADLALHALEPTSPARANVEEIDRASRRAADLCRQMLAYSGRGRFVVGFHDLSEIAREMTRMLEISIPKNASLRCAFAADLPPVEVDATQVRQVVLNLVTNAAEALRGRDGIVAVSTGHADPDGASSGGSAQGDGLPAARYVFLEVSDTGCGMDEETRRRIFDPFFTTKASGRGLGLAAVRGIVRGHKGAVRVDSEPGQGTTFRVLFPAAERPRGVAGRHATTETRPRRGGTILLVDDDVHVRTVGSEMLELLGFKVVTAKNGREGVDAFRAAGNEIALVILDLTMPEMSGDEALGEIRRIRGDVPVVLSSGYGEQEVLQRFAGRGVNGFVQKPYTLAMVRETLTRVLG